MGLLPQPWAEATGIPIAEDIFDDHDDDHNPSTSRRSSMSYGLIGRVNNKLGVRQMDSTTPLLGSDDETDHASNHVSENMQAGVQKAQATTVVWSRSHLILAYVFIFMIYFVDSLQQQMASAFDPFVTSSFRLHSLTATTRIVSSIIGGLTKLPLAKILDIWGRPQGFLLMVIALTIGLVMMAVTENVQMYCAAQVFYWMGQNGISYSLSIFIADTSSLRNRSLMFAFSASPYMITTWIAGPMAQAFIRGWGWRWGFRIFAVVTPIMATSLLILFAHNYRKAKRAGVMPVKPYVDRTFRQSVQHYVVEFDVVGLLLSAVGLALFLLPFSLHTLQPEGWRSPLMIGMLLVGVALIITFVVWERSSYCTVKFVPWTLLHDRTVFGANLLPGVLFASFFIWDGYFVSFLLVVQNLSVTHANYVNSIFSIGGCLWAIVTGVVMRKVGRFKPLALYFGVPVTILGVALMMHFRQPHSSIWGIVFCQLLIALAGGTLVICEQIAAMAATTQQYVAVVLAIEGMFSSVGAAVGLTVATALWTATFPAKLKQYLPDEAQGNLQAIYGDIAVQLGYPVGTPERDAINAAYGETQKLMLIASTALLAIAVVCVAIWRDINVKHLKQVKGTVI